MHDQVHVRKNIVNYVVEVMIQVPIPMKINGENIFATKQWMP
jgi:hypothetical protein